MSGASSGREVCAETGRSSALGRMQAQFPGSAASQHRDPEAELSSLSLSFLRWERASPREVVRTECSQVWAVPSAQEMLNTCPQPYSLTDSSGPLKGAAILGGSQGRPLSSLTDEGPFRQSPTHRAAVGPVTASPTLLLLSLTPPPREWKPPSCVCNSSWCLIKGLALVSPRNSCKRRNILEPKARSGSRECSFPDCPAQRPWMPQPSG